MRRLIRPLGVAVLIATLAWTLPFGAGVASASEPSEGGIAALGFNLPGLIAQIINFGVLLLILRLFLYPPLMRVLDERKRRIQEGLERAEQAAEEAQASEGEARRIMEAARTEAREIVASSQETAQRLREDLEQRARVDAEQIVTRAREEIGIERNQAIEQLRGEFADLTITAAERVIGQALDRDAHQRLIDEVIVSSEIGRSMNN